MNRQEITARYRAAHPERVADARHRWRRSNVWEADSRCVWKARRRARAFGLDSGDLTKEAVARLRLLPCEYCGVMPAGSIDHVIPMMAGGPNTVANLVPCCIRCNHLKGYPR